MRVMWLGLLVCVVCCGCSEKRPETGSSIAAVDAADFAVLETELSPAILVHSKSKYLSVLTETSAPASHIAFATRNGPRPFRRGERLKADELEECWLMVWGANVPPWVVYLQHKPLALSLDTNGLHFSFANGAGDVVLLPLHGSSTNVDTKKWSEFLKREPLLRIRYWASVLREFPFECQTTLMPSNAVHQRFRYHSIRDHWKTKPLQLAPVPPPLAAMADEQLKRKLMDLEMPTPFGPYRAFEGMSEWTASFPSAVVKTNCAWATLGECKLSAPNTSLIPGIPGLGSIRPTREQPPSKPTQTLLNPSTRVISYPGG